MAQKQKNTTEERKEEARKRRQDVDEHEKDVFDKDGFLQIAEDEEINEGDEELLKKFQLTAPKSILKKADASDDEEGDSKGVMLSDLVMQKLQENKSQGASALMTLDEEMEQKLEPRVTAAYRSIATIMKTFSSGKLPKAFKIIPMCANWEELLCLTKPESWSPAATYEATKIFCSNLNTKLVQRFYNAVLLPNVRSNIQTYKKLNLHLYKAIKKAIFKPAAFFKGFLLPLSINCSTREAVIVGSVLMKCSLPILHASAALIKMTQQEYNLGTGYFIKIVVGKKFSLPTRVIDTLVDFFSNFETYEDTLPVMWH